jgi:glycosyltransferase involved in cell wall biosynthesis
MPSVIDVTAFEYDKDIKEHFKQKHQLSGYPILGHVGRFSLEKNHAFLIEMFHSIQLEYPEASLCLVGEGPEKVNIMNLVDELGMSKKIHFLPPLPNIHEFLCAIDVFLLPSIYEGVPGVIIEAQAASTPVVMSNNITKDVIFSDFVLQSNLKNNSQWVSSIQKAVDLSQDREILKFDAHKFDIKTQIDVYYDLYK